MELEILQERGLVYLAVPYSHKDPYIKSLRFAHVNKVAGILMSKGVKVFSPISHTHPIAEAHQLPGNWEFWKDYDEVILKSCSILAVLMLEGWDSSVGVAGEMDIANDLGIPVTYLELNDILNLDV